MNLIEHVFSPKRLLLTWQGQDRAWRVVGELTDRDGVVSFRYLTETDDFAKARDSGFVCYPAFRKPGVIYTEGVMDSFLRRLPPRSRGDFRKFLEQWRLPVTAELSDFALLAYVGGKLPTDGFAVVWPLEEMQAPAEVLLEVAGLRYQDVEREDLAIGMPADFVREPDNPKDARAISVLVQGRRIGYVRRQQRDAVSNWLDRYHVSATLERINGTKERPVVYLFCRVTEPRQNTGWLAASG